MSENTGKIPQEFEELGRELIALAKKYGLRQIGGKLSPGFKSTWHDDVHFNWCSGRHGDEEHRLELTSSHQTIVRAEVKP